MRTVRAPKYTWTDDQLTNAVQDSACWLDAVEQAIYDLLVHSSEEIHRVQVKTTTASGGAVGVGLTEVRWRCSLISKSGEEVRGMADVDAWLGEVGAALDVSAEVVLPEDVQAEMLDLTGDIAHSVVRYAVPLTSYLMGVAVGRGASPQEALRIVGGLLRQMEK